MFNHKKEIIELKKHINKLNSERHVANGANEIYNNDDVKEKEYENDDYPKKGKQLNKKKEPYETNYEYEEYEEYKGKKNSNNNISKNNIKNLRKQYKNTDPYDNEDIYNDKKKYQKTDLNVYNNKINKKTKNYEYTQNEEEQDYEEQENIKNKDRYKYNKKNEESNSDKNSEIKNNKKLEKSREENKINYNQRAKREEEFITIIREKGKIIGCDKEKMQSLIDNREYQIVERELSILIKEKDKLEGDLLKMPEHPRKLNDIRNKKEINEIIEKIESDIGQTRIMLKRTNDYYVKKN